MIVTFYDEKRQQNKQSSFKIALLNCHAFVCESGSTLGLGAQCHGLIAKFGYQSLRLTQIRAVAFLVLVHTFSILSYVCIFHEVSLRSHVGVSLGRYYRITDAFGTLAGTLSGFWSDEFCWGARFLI